MNLYVISDTHDYPEPAIEIFNRLGFVDIIVHLGDKIRDAQKIAKATGKTVICVPGNNDFTYSGPDFEILETACGNILLTHGHMQGVKSGLQRLVYRAQELDCKAAFFGHTHYPFNEKANGIHLLNPGSFTYPMNGVPSYALVNVSEAGLAASIINV